MGLNFYVVFDFNLKEQTNKVIHLGKRSHLFKFVFCSHDHVETDSSESEWELKAYDHWVHFIAYNQTVIVDEYGRQYDSGVFMQSIIDRQVSPHMKDGICDFKDKDGFMFVKGEWI